MPRKGNVNNPEVRPDYLYNSKVVTKIINQVMLDGKKTTAEKIFYDALKLVAELTNEDAIVVLEQALENIKPELEVKSRRIGGSNYQVPVEVRPERRQTLGIRWLVNYSRLRRERTQVERLAKEIVDASNNSGASVKKKEDIHRMAEANKAFAHYRW